MSDIEDKEQLTKIIADRGYANGMKAAALLLDKVVEQHTRVVGTNTLREIASILREKAEEMHATALASLKELQEKTDVGTA